MKALFKFGTLLAALLVVKCAASGDEGIRPGVGLDASIDGGALPDGNVSDAPAGFDVNVDSGCVPPSCQDLGANCGPVTDTKCGGVVDCGSCPSGEVCGAGGPNLCGTGIPDGGTCTPQTCADLGANCGMVLDGCGTLIDCGSCMAGEACGLGGPNVCGATTPDGGSCTPKTCASQSISCGPAGDGCGNTLACGSCPSGQSCGGGGVQGKCGAPTCTPLSCASQNVSCGAAGDGCGNVLNCGACALPQICGGAGTPGQCGCTGVCSQVPTCPGSQTTTLSGKVFDPGGFNPLYNVLVYIPNDPSDPGLNSFPLGPSCDVCGAAAAGDPLVTAKTATDGSFTLSNVPVGSNITLVIQLGRWRRKFSVNVGNSCGANTVSGTGISGGVLRMPKNKSEGNIPLTAIVTGNSDALECVFSKMGIDQAEFTNPSANGRIHLFQGDINTNITIPPGYQPPNDRGYTNCVKTGPIYNCQYHGGGARIDANTPSQTALFAGNTMDKYDMVIMSCQGADAGTAGDPSLSQYSKLVNYTGGGGRMFASHFSYTYLTQGGSANPFYGTASWTAPGAQYTSRLGFVDTVSNPKGSAFAQWLSIVGALSAPTPPQLTIFEPRADSSGVVSPTQQWLYWNDTGNKKVPLHFTFNAPVGAASASQCGRGLFSDFHVVLTTGGTGTTGTYNVNFPGECSTGPLTPQEKVLEFMLFDLGSCVQPYQPLCTPRSCAQQGVSCGPAGDGCGGLIQCGNCSAGQVCGGGGTPGKCGGSACQPLTCTQQGVSCGPAGDGCGNLIQCGNCPSGQTCGGGGVPGKCGAPDGGSCTPLSCASQSIQCGPAGDGCGNVLQCGSCPTGQSCGGGGLPGQCGAPSCTPRSCSQQGIECGLAGDGCGGTLDCGNCPAGQVCGLDAPGKCGSVN